jgi:SUMO ligase MMS21 Smc5/6 complex component
MSQRTQSQSQRQSGQGSRGDDEDESDEDEGPTPGPTPLGKERVELTGLSEMFEDKMEKEKIAYYSRSHKSRYAQDNDYIHFKKMVHDARYGDEGPPLPHADTWFTEQGIPALGVTETQGDNDDDIIVDRANISIRCPLTFQQFKEPYSSKKCPHTFEKNAIQTYIRNARVLRGEEKVVQCPVPGCEQVSLPGTYRAVVPC